MQYVPRVVKLTETSNHPDSRLRCFSWTGQEGFITSCFILITLNWVVYSLKKLKSRYIYILQLICGHVMQCVLILAKVSKKNIVLWLLKMQWLMINDWSLVAETKVYNVEFSLLSSWVIATMLFYLHCSHESWLRCKMYEIWSRKQKVLANKYLKIW